MNIFRILIVVGWFLCSGGELVAQSSTVKPEVTLNDNGSAIAVMVGDELFCKYNYREFSKPIIYPIYLMPGISMTRNFPMKETVGEAKDHPHHMSLWLGHEISGVDFWANRTGKIVFQKLESIDAEKNQFTVVNQWRRKSDDGLMLTETTSYRFGADGNSRWIDARIQFVANQRVVFEDTKEGLFAIRTHPSLRLSPDQRRGVEVVTGQAVNDSGVSGKSIWGKPAKWVDYHGKIDGKSVGITLMDHPDNLRHPTTWHAREYGLVAANPFGLHYFAKGPKRGGEVVLEEGDALNLIYGVRFYQGDFDSKKSEMRFREFSQRDW